MKSYQMILDFFSDEERKMLLDVAYKLPWEEGRQQTGYLKSAINQVDERFAPLVARSKIAIGAAEVDCYILKYPVGSRIDNHVDDAPFGSAHYRLNAMLKNSISGGRFLLESRVVDIQQRDAIIFRPDIMTHSVGTVKQGERYVWSVGALK